MPNKFKNKYRITSTRLNHWNYGSNGIYFITICTQHQVCFFGDVKNGEMELNAIGRLAHEFWMEIPNHFSFVELGNFVVMPNHMHGILMVNKTDAQLTNDIQSQSTNDVEARLIAPLRTERGGITGEKNPMLHENISRIIRWYKGRCSFEIRKHQADFQWQSRFYDIIVRNEQSFQNISRYIQNNPQKWGHDKLPPLINTMI